MSDGITWNFTDAQGRCFIAGAEVPREVYDEFEAAWARVATLEGGIRRVADHADRLTHLPAVVIAPDLRALLDASHDQEGNHEQ